MDDQIKLGAAQALSPAGQAQASTTSETSFAAGASSEVESGAAFKALLERMEQSAIDLRRASQSLDSPAELGRAVESARVSVQEAVTLGSDLLEAFRAAQQRGDQLETNDDGPDVARRSNDSQGDSNRQDGSGGSRSTNR